MPPESPSPIDLPLGLDRAWIDECDSAIMTADGRAIHGTSREAERIATALVDRYNAYPALLACVAALRALLDGIEYPPPNSGRTGYLWLPRKRIDEALTALAAIPKEA